MKKNIIVSEEQLRILSNKLKNVNENKESHSMAKKQLFTINRKDFFGILGVGALVTLHWLCFFQSIKVSTVSVAVVCLATSSLFSALIEPLFLLLKYIFPIIVSSISIFSSDSNMFLASRADTKDFLLIFLTMSALLKFIRLFTILELRFHLYLKICSQYHYKLIRFQLNLKLLC